MRWDIEIRREAERLAAETGWDADELIAEARRIVSGYTWTDRRLRENWP